MAFSFVMRAPPWLTVALTLTVGSPAWAQSDEESARFELLRAIQRCHRGDYSRALVSFRRSLDRGRTPHALAEMGLCERRAEHWIDAEEHLTQSIESPDDWVSSHRGTIDLALEETRAHIGRLVLIGGPDGAELRVNGTATGTLPREEPLRLASGRVRLEASLRGWRTWHRELDLAGGGTTHENVTMEREEFSSPQAPSTQTSQPVRCPAGLVARGQLCYSPDGATRARSGVRPGQVAMIVGGSVAAIAGIIAVVFAVDGDSLESDFLSRCGGAHAPVGCLSERQNLQSDLDDRATAVNTLIAVAGVGLATVVIGLITDQVTTRQHRSRFALTPSGLSLRW